MSFVQTLRTLGLYGADVLLIALGATAIVALLKKTVLKKCPAKVLVFLPFAAGTALFGVYRAIVTMGVSDFTAELFATLEGGFASGCAASILGALLERAASGKSEALPPLYPLLGGIVPEEKRKEAAQALADGAASLPEEEKPAALAETLKRYADPPLAEEELVFYARFFAAYLASLRDAK